MISITAEMGDNQIIQQLCNVNVYLQDMEEKHGLKVTLFDKIGTLWKQFDQALKSYQTSTNSRKQEFEEYKRRDDHAAQEIDTQMRRINKLWVRTILIRFCVHHYHCPLVKQQSIILKLALPVGLRI